MNRVIHYLPCSIVCHGECELILVRQIQLKKKRNLNPLANSGGKQSILIGTINYYLKKLFPDKRSYIRKYGDALIYDKKTKKILKHKIFTIMDKDDASDSLFNSYVDKTLFKDEWWGEEELIEPIYFNPNMDDILIKHGIKIDKHKHKPMQYFKLLTSKYDEIINVLRSLNDDESNIKVLFEYLNSFKNEEQK